MKKIAILTLLGLLSFVVFFLTTIPAPVAWSVLEDRKLIPDAMTVTDLDGTLWEGSAGMVSIHGEQLPQVTWAFSSSTMLQQTLQQKLEFDVQTGRRRSGLFSRGQVSWDGKTIQLTDFKGKASRKQVHEWLQLPYPIDIDGTLSFSIDELQVKGSRCSALDGSGVMNSAEARTPFGNIDLGQVLFDFSCKSRRINIVARQSSEELKVDARVTVDMNGRYSISGSLAPQSGLAEPFRNSLSLLGKVNSNGEYALKAKGRL